MIIQCIETVQTEQHKMEFSEVSLYQCWSTEILQYMDKINHIVSDITEGFVQNQNKLNLYSGDKHQAHAECVDMEC